MSAPPIPISKRLRLLREDRRLRLVDVARHSGIARETLSKLERGITVLPHERTLVRLAAVYGLTVEELRTQIGMLPNRPAMLPSATIWSPQVERIAARVAALRPTDRQLVEGMLLLIAARDGTPSEHTALDGRVFEELLGLLLAREQDVRGALQRLRSALRRVGSGDTRAEDRRC